ncbi:uncharacterized protein LOC114263177 [Camellia sinensis]|uniref:uncharacterized protein LOC114263177 n=1 Tax=Camellia sinensis TaxID=4442 RepID=UPI0010364FA1|nr:uncharacterized protein LOC114263177 [Camellia sinensis]
MLGKPIAILRLLHYEGRVFDPMKGIYGAGAHSDFGLITLLATDDVYGLQSIYSESWRHARALEQLYFQIAYFVEPSHDCVVDCLPACQSQENPPKYELNTDKLFIPVSDLSMNMN